MANHDWFWANQPRFESWRDYQPSAGPPLSAAPYLLKPDQHLLEEITHGHADASPSTLTRRRPPRGRCPRSGGGTACGPGGGRAGASAGIPASKSSGASIWRFVRLSFTSASSIRQGVLMRKLAHPKWAWPNSVVEEELDAVVGARRRMTAGHPFAFSTSPSVGVRRTRGHVHSYARQTFNQPRREY